MGAGSAVKKDDCSQLKLPELGKLEAGATSPLSDNFTLLSIEVNDDQLAITYSMAMRLVEMIINFKIFDLLDNWNANDGSLQPVVSPKPMYLMIDYAKLSIR